jgi:hypothetical protein
VPVALVLCTGIDSVLIENRRLILQAAGHTVIAVTNEVDLTSACEKHRFNVAVIGQAISSDMERAIFSRIREQCPSAKILELYAQHQGRTLKDADSWLEVPAEVPQQLAERVNELAAKKSKNAGA